MKLSEAFTKSIKRKCGRCTAGQLPDTTAAAKELVKRAMFPEVAKHLLNRPVAEKVKSPHGLVGGGP